MSTPSYEQALADYQQAFHALYRSSGHNVERGGALQLDGLLERGDAAFNAARQMGDVLAAAVDSDDPELRDVAALKLLASAAADLATAGDILKASNETTEVERSGPLLNRPEIREVLEAPLEGRTVRAFAAERAALPSNPAQARIALQDTVSHALKEIPSQASDLSLSVITGATTFGLGPAQALLSGGLDEVLKHLPTIGTVVLRTAARLISEAIRKVWAAFGKQAQDDIQKDAQSWLQSLWNNGGLVSGLVGNLYELKKIEAEVAEKIKDASEKSDFNQANRKCEELVARYTRIKSMLDWVLRALGWLKAPLMAAVPWGPVGAYTIYTAVLGYSIYSGGDYVDADRFRSAWLDHVVGVRAVVTSTLTTI